MEYSIVKRKKRRSNKETLEGFGFQKTLPSIIILTPDMEVRNK